MNITLSIDDDLVDQARRQAERFGTSLNQVIRELLKEYVGKSDGKKLAEEFVRLSRESHGNSKGWKFNREEIHERR